MKRFYKIYTVKDGVTTYQTDTPSSRGLRYAVAIAEAYQRKESAESYHVESPASVMSNAPKNEAILWRAA